MMGASWFTSNRISAKLVCRSPRLEKEGDPFSFSLGKLVYLFIYLHVAQGNLPTDFARYLHRMKGESVNDEIFFFSLGVERSQMLKPLRRGEFWGTMWWKRGRHGHFGWSHMMLDAMNCQSFCWKLQRWWFHPMSCGETGQSCIAMFRVRTVTKPVFQPQDGNGVSKGRRK